MKVTGTWTAPSSVIGWKHIWVHIPDNGATTFQADYKVFTGSKTLHRVVNQRWNDNVWVDLGIFQLSAGAKVSLSNVSYSDGNGTVDIAWDAVAFTSAAKPVVSYAYVALGDSYQSGEGNEPYYSASDNGASTPGYVDECHRSAHGYPALVFSRMRAASSSRTTGNTEFHFPACSGAVTASVVGNLTQSMEVPQLQQGWLDENTTRVTVGIGGNDARFVAIIKACLIDRISCLSNGYTLTVKDEENHSIRDPEPLVTYEPKVIDTIGATGGPLDTWYAYPRTPAMRPAPPSERNGCDRP